MRLTGRNPDVWRPFWSFLEQAGEFGGVSGRLEDGAEAEFGGPGVPPFSSSSTTATAGEDEEEYASEATFDGSETVDNEDEGNFDADEFGTSEESEVDHEGNWVVDDDEEGDYDDNGGDNDDDDDDNGAIGDGNDGGDFSDL